MSSPYPPGAAVSPSTARNREPILLAARPRLPAAGLVLEVAAGAGEHAIYLAAALPALQWRPTDRDPQALASALQKIEAYAHQAHNPGAERNPATAHLFIINPLAGRRVDQLFHGPRLGAAEVVGTAVAERRPPDTIGELGGGAPRPVSFISAATRLAVAGWVENRLSAPWPFNGLMMNICPVAGLRSAVTLVMPWA